MCERTCYARSIIHRFVCVEDFESGVASCFFVARVFMKDEDVCDRDIRCLVRVMWSWSFSQISKISISSNRGVTHLHLGSTSH